MTHFGVIVRMTGEGNTNVWKANLIVREARRKHKYRAGHRWLRGFGNFGRAQIKTTLGHGSEELTRSINVRNLQVNPCGG